MSERAHPRRNRFRIGLLLATLLVAAGGLAWGGTTLYVRLGSGYLNQPELGAPLIGYTPGSEPSEALIWQPVASTTTDLRQIEIPYPTDDGSPGEVMTLRASTDADGRVHLTSARGCNPLVPSPDGRLYFFDGAGELYLVDADGPTVSRLTSWDYKGKSRRLLNAERGYAVRWADCPLWTPDGKSVVFLTDRAGAPELWRVDVQGGAETCVMSCTENHWYLHGWTKDGRLVVGVMKDGGEFDLYLVDLATKVTEHALHGYNYCVVAPYVAFCDSPEAAGMTLFCDLNTLAVTTLPSPPEGYVFRMPFTVSPAGTRLALWLSTKDGDYQVGIVDLETDPPALTTYPPPQPGRVTGGLYWLDDSTLGVQSGSIGDPDAATYALRVGD